MYSTTLRLYGIHTLLYHLLVLHIYWFAVCGFSYSLFITQQWSPLYWDYVLPTSGLHHSDYSITQDWQA